MNEEPGAVFDAHVRAEFVERSVDATMATMTDSPYVTHVPVLTGGNGRDEVRAFYESWFVGRWPADTQVTQVSRTVGQGRVIDELIVSFTHDVEMPALLPGIAPTGRKVVLAHVVLMGIVDGKVAYEHIYWDQASPARAGRSPRSRRPAGGRCRAGCDASRPYTIVERIDPSRRAAKGLIGGSPRMTFLRANGGERAGSTRDGQNAARENV
jgi:carboxymethylenebutenolidase